MIRTYISDPFKICGNYIGKSSLQCTNYTILQYWRRFRLSLFKELRRRRLLLGLLLVWHITVTNSICNYQPLQVIILSKFCSVFKYTGKTAFHSVFDKFQVIPFLILIFLFFRGTAWNFRALTSEQGHPALS